jgi:hypothetical protein
MDSIIFFLLDRIYRIFRIYLYSWFPATGPWGLRPGFLLVELTARREGRNKEYSIACGENNFIDLRKLYVKKISNLLVISGIYFPLKADFIYLSLPERAKES